MEVDTAIGLSIYVWTWSRSTITVVDACCRSRLLSWWTRALLPCAKSSTEHRLSSA